MPRGTNFWCSSYSSAQGHQAPGASGECLPLLRTSRPQGQTISSPIFQWRFVIGNSELGFASIQLGQALSHSYMPSRSREVFVRALRAHTAPCMNNELHSRSRRPRVPLTRSCKGGQLDATKMSLAGSCYVARTRGAESMVHPLMFSHSACCLPSHRQPRSQSRSGRHD